MSLKLKVLTNLWRGQVFKKYLTLIIKSKESHTFSKSIYTYLIRYIIQIKFHFSFQDATKTETLEDNLDADLTLERHGHRRGNIVTNIILPRVNISDQHHICQSLDPTLCYFSTQDFLLLGCRDRMRCSHSWCRFPQLKEWVARNCPTTCGLCSRPEESLERAGNKKISLIYHKQYEKNHKLFKKHLQKLDILISSNHDIHKNVIIYSSRTSCAKLCKRITILIHDIFVYQHIIITINIQFFQQVILCKMLHNLRH